MARPSAKSSMVCLNYGSICLMNFKICVVTHAIPNAIGIALPAVVMLTVKQSVLVMNGLLQTYPSITMCTIHILTIVFLHDLLP